MENFPKAILTSEYVAQQFVERLVHYILSVPTGSYTMAQLSHLLEQLDPRDTGLFFQTPQRNQPGQPEGFRPTLLRLYE